MELTNLSSMQLDVLREIGNIGAGNAITSMSTFLNKRIEMQLPSVEIVTFNEMMELLGGPEKVVVAMLFRIYGEAKGTVYFILSIEEAESLVNELSAGVTLNFFGEEEPDEFAISILKEVGNIMTGSYLTALSDFTQINMQPSIPYLAVDMLGSILTDGLIELSRVSDYAIMVDTEISDYEQHGIRGHFLLLPEYESLQKIFTALGVNGHG